MNGAAEASGGRRLIQQERASAREELLAQRVADRAKRKGAIEQRRTEKEQAKQVVREAREQARRAMPHVDS